MTMLDPAATLRLMNASPQLADALQRLLPLARREYQELAAMAAFSDGTSSAQREADRWLEAIMLGECALKDALPPALQTEIVANNHDVLTEQVRKNLCLMLVRK